MKTERKTIAVVGLGYVGLPLAVLAARKGYKVLGFDISIKRIEQLTSGRSPIGDLTDEQVSKSGITFTDKPSDLAQADISIICVPTPLIEETQMPDLEPVKGAVKLVGPQLKPGALLILESTVNPGVCDEVVIPLLTEVTGKKAGTDFQIAYCPERINPGDDTWNVSNINRVVGGDTTEALRRAAEFYRSIIDAEVKEMGSLKEAEAVKVVENSFRDINIAFVNELAMSFHRLGINLENVIDGASTKPFAFMAHHPGCGVGGHCIPIDPYYLIEYARGHGFEHDFLMQARQINEYMPKFTVELLEEALAEKHRELKGVKVALLGVSYKANVGDSRESPSYELKKLLEKAGADVTVYDPFVPTESTVKTLDEALDTAKAILIATGHKQFIAALTPENLTKYKVDVVVDGRNVLRHSKDAVVKAGIAYRGIGI